MRTPSPSFLALSLVSVGLIACGDPPAPSEVRSRLSDDLGHVMRESAAAAAGSTDALPGSSSFGFLETALGQSSSSGSTLRVIGDVASRFRSFAQTGAGRTQQFVAGDLDTDALVAQLNQTIFTDANEVEDGVYAVPADLACSSTTIDSLGNETTAIDPDCAASWAKIALRIRVAEDGDALAFSIQLGANHDEPLVITLTHNSLAVSVDLDEAEAATEALASAFGETAPNARLAGRFTGKLTVLGAAHIDASYTIDRALDIAVADAGIDLDGADAFRMTSGAGRVFDLELDGNAAAGSFDVDLQATTIHTPGIDGFDLDLPGASLSADLAAGQPLHLTNISLGDRTTTVKKNGLTAVSIDLNADAGRTFEATISGDAATGEETLSVSPKLDARIAIDHAALGDIAPRFDVTRVMLAGSLRNSTATNQVKVDSGTFAITTNPAQYGFSASAGQCVAGEDTYDAATGDYYTAWTVGACL